MNRDQRRTPAPAAEAGKHGDGKGKPSIVRTGMMLVGIVILGSGIVVLARPTTPVPVPTNNSVSAAALTGGSATNSSSIDAVNLDPKPNPRPANYYYDQTNNRHWVTACDHWHPGPAPAAPQLASSGDGNIALQPIDNPFGSQNPFANQLGAGAQQPVREVDRAPWPMPNPPDMYFDAPNNRHWHAGHGHWHEGPPPATAGTAPAGTAPTALPPGTFSGGGGTTGDEGDSPLRQNR